MREPDKRVEPILGSTPSYSYQNKLATVYEAKTRGEKFLPLPGGYIPSPGEVPRGGAFPYVQSMEQGIQPPASTPQDPNTLNTMMNPQTVIGDKAMSKRGLLPGASGSGKPNKRMK